MLGDTATVRITLVDYERLFNVTSAVRSKAGCSAVTFLRRLPPRLKSNLKFYDTPRFARSAKLGAITRF